MQLRRALPNLSEPKTLSQGIVSLGNFDGVHLGHQALLSEVSRMAKSQGCDSHVITFNPHPRDYFAALGIGAPVSSICNLRDRLERLQLAGINHVHLLQFNSSIATLSPAQFVERALVKACNAKHVIVGHDVRFGHKRAGDLALLKSLGHKHGFEVHTVNDLLSTAAVRISSSIIRDALQAGDLKTARTLLGRDLAVSGRVIHGRKIGRTLACPTLNLVPHMTNPAFKGVCVVAVDGLAGSASQLYGVASLGLRPTVEQTQRYSLEVHVFNWSGNAYGQRVKVRFLHKLRDEAAYVDLLTLQHAIAQDMRDAQNWLGLNQGA